MGAKPQPERKADVLNAMADYLLGNGLADATLRLAASKLGTSARMLLYHFGSKEELLVAALAEVRRREIEMLAREVMAHPAGSTADVLRNIWRWYASPSRRPYLRLFFEAWGVSLQQPYLFKGFLENVRKDLLPLFEETLVQRGYPRRHATAIATFIIAAFRGLLIDMVANDDQDRLDDALEIFVLVTEVMEAKGPLAASEAFRGVRDRGVPAANTRSDKRRAVSKGTRGAGRRRTDRSR